MSRYSVFSANAPVFSPQSEQVVIVSSSSGKVIQTKSTPTFSGSFRPPRNPRVIVVSSTTGKVTKKIDDVPDPRERAQKIFDEWRRKRQMQKRESKFSVRDATSIKFFDTAESLVSYQKEQISLFSEFSEMSDDDEE